MGFFSKIWKNVERAVDKISDVQSRAFEDLGIKSLGKRIDRFGRDVTDQVIQMQRRLRKQTSKLGLSKIPVVGGALERAITPDVAARLGSFSPLPGGSHVLGTLVPQLEQRKALRDAGVSSSKATTLQATRFGIGVVEGFAKALGAGVFGGGVSGAGVQGAGRRVNAPTVALPKTPGGKMSFFGDFGGGFTGSGDPGGSFGGFLGDLTGTIAKEAIGVGLQVGKAKLQQKLAPRPPRSFVAGGPELRPTDLGVLDRLIPGIPHPLPAAERFGRSLVAPRGGATGDFSRNGGSMPGPNGYSTVYPMGTGSRLRSSAFEDLPGGVKAGWMKGTYKPYQLEDGTVVMREKKRRRMNVLNPKANARAARRLSGFVKAVKRTKRTLQKIGKL